jgi:hypothetical protein
MNTNSNLYRFDICKVMQRRYQTVENRDVVAESSIVEADFYGKRFREFLFERVFHPADDEISTTLPTSNESSTFSRSSLYPQLPVFDQ